MSLNKGSKSAYQHREGCEKPKKEERSLGET